MAAAANPEGVKLAQENLQMLVDLLPRPLRWLGLGIVPRLYMQDLIGLEGCIRVGISPMLQAGPLNWLLVHGASLMLTPFTKGDNPSNPHDRWSRALFQHLIDNQYGGKVTFLMPQDLADMQKLA